MIPKPTAHLSAISTARTISINLYRYYKSNVLYPIIRFFRRCSYLSVLHWFSPVFCVVKDKRSFFQKLSLITLLALWVFVGHASAQSVSLTHVTDGTAGTVSGQGTEIVVDLSQEGMTRSVYAIQIMFEFDASLLSLTAPSGWLLSGNDTVTLLSITAILMPASVRFTFTTKVDVTGREFSIGIKEISLDQVTLTPSAIVWFNLPHLYLDTQIESPAQNNSVLTLSAKRPGDTIVFQLFAPELAGQQFNVIQLELALQGKRLSNYISSRGGWLSQQVSGSGNLVLTMLSLRSISVPSSGYLGQIDLSVIGTLTSDDLLRVQSGNLVIGDDIQNLTVSNAVLTFISLCPGDFDNNGIVGIPDFLLFVDVFGTSLGDARYNALMDMDGNGVIGIPDFLAFVKVFGTKCPKVGGQGGNQVSGSDLVVGIDPIGGSYHPIGGIYLSLMPGDSFVFWIGVRNQGTGSSAATTLRYYRSDDAILTNSDTQVGSTQVGALEASDASGDRITFTAPSSVGTYYYGGCVDPVSGESNTNNNCSGVQVTVTGGSVSQREALVALYNATDGANWTNNTNWLSGNDISTWYGVRVSNGWVTRLELHNNNLIGSIPTELGNLTNLENLSLNNNELSGSIPTELGNLTNLERLFLYINALSGSIPTELGNLTNLENLSLNNNELSGSIPTELGNLTNLENLWLNNNELSGSIPIELGNLTNLENLFLHNNALSGSIPTELGNLTNLENLSLNNNELSGSIPTELGNLTNLESLWLNNNELSGSIPTELGNLTNLERLFLYNNELSGSIPTELGNLTNLESLWLNDNTSLAGALPQSLIRLTKLERFHFLNTGLCAPLDAAFQAWLHGIASRSGSNCSTTGTGGGQVSGSDLVVGIDPIGLIYLSLMPGDSFVFWIGVRNQGTGSSAATTLRYYRSDDAILTNSDTQVGSTQVGALEASDGSGDRITFTAPSSVGTYYYGGCVDPVSGESNTNNNCSGVQVTVTEGRVSQREALVALYNATDGANWTDNTNWLSGNNIFTWYGVRASNGWVTSLELYDNNLIGSIPTELGNLTNLEWLSLDDNALSGSIPTELGNLTNLTELWLNKNQLSGSIPTELGNLTNLTGLWLDKNQLSGSIPTELGNLTNLTELWLNDNTSLAGALPQSLTRLTKLEIFHFLNTGLCAPLDAAFQAWLQGISTTSGPNCSG